MSFTPYLFQIRTLYKLLINCHVLSWEDKLCPSLNIPLYILSSFVQYSNHEYVDQEYITVSHEERMDQQHY